jgi:hypothetical protein
MQNASMKVSQPLHRVALLRAGTMTALMVILVAGIFVIPVITQGDDVGRAVNDTALTLILLSGAAAVFAPRPFPMAAAILCGVAIVLRWAEWAVPPGWWSFAHTGSALLALFLVTAIVAFRVFGADLTTVTELVATHVADAFSGVRPTGSGPQRWLYFSFVTLTTVGYGDLVPVAPAARSLATLEALLGQLYPAIILARLVSLQIK